ncbi:unnamed protein product [Arabidopsis arenosa]|uniref:phosphoenolpyruvate carboxykinase (ATP) n=1 Tax=Arabidopsis arenosa TaxID=38785 RepID=A0A8S2B5M7_ARAAE|nr:unnamed protein product [Arabidopsis arenosa]
MFYAWKWRERETKIPVETSVSRAAAARDALPRITTEKGGKSTDVCHDDTAPRVNFQTIDELHSLQKKRSAPTTPLRDGSASGVSGTSGPTTPVSSETMLQSVSASLASLTRETGPKLIRGDPTSAANVAHVPVTPTSLPTADVSDSGLKFTHILHNLSPAGNNPLNVTVLNQGPNLILIVVTSTGALATLSGAKTGRSPKDKRVVKDETTEAELWWGKGSPNIEMDEQTFLVNRERAVDYLNSLDKVFVNDQYLNWDPENRIKVRIVSARAYHSLFMHNMCIRPTPEELENFGTPDFTIYNAGKFPCNRFTHYMTSSTSVDINLGRREMVILGTQYAGEMKKGLFGVMHYLMPKRKILSLHSGCNMGKDGDVALFFGLSGTGKTTLSTDHNRYLIGDDEHCWSETGVSNIEGGCYAKCIDLAREKEPDIWNAIKFGTVLENVVFDEHTREVDYTDKSVTENTRAAYPMSTFRTRRYRALDHTRRTGYTALVAGTEEGVKEPRATFSACFGAAFIMLHPTKYAAMLAEKMQAQGATGWLVNTGWSGGSYGSGSRIKLAYTRKIIDAIHSGVPSEILEPINAWEDKMAYEDTLLKLAGLFKSNFETFTSHKIGDDGKLTEEILQLVLTSE